MYLLIPPIKITLGKYTDYQLIKPLRKNQAFYLSKSTYAFGILPSLVLRDQLIPLVYLPSKPILSLDNEIPEKIFLK